LHGFTRETLRALELHEARAHLRGERRVDDLGDAILLVDPQEPDPFLNRLSGLRLPDDPAAFDRRLTELLALFAAAGRQAHVWQPSAFESPDDLVERLGADGFVDIGGTYAMLTTDAMATPDPALPPRARLYRLAEAGPRRATVIRGIASVLADAFATEPGLSIAIVADLNLTAGPAHDVVLLTVEGRAVATGRRYTADGATYLSSIGTRHEAWGRGYGSAVTAALIGDGRAAGGPLVHLAVETDNDRALAMYQRLGFEILGGRRADLLLT
jgi:GNAT superfamily N-acetyltransferase